MLILNIVNLMVCLFAYGTILYLLISGKLKREKGEKRDKGDSATNSESNIRLFEVLHEGKSTGKVVVEGGSAYRVALASPEYELKDTKTGEVIEGFKLC